MVLKCAMLLDLCDVKSRKIGPLKGWGAGAVLRRDQRDRELLRFKEAAFT